MSDYVNYIDITPSGFDVRVQMRYQTETLGGGLIRDEFSDVVMTKEFLSDFLLHLHTAYESGRPQEVRR